LEHDLLVAQHPFYWYSTPALVKQWQDLVLEHGGRTAPAERGCGGSSGLSAITTGGREAAYQHDGLKPLHDPRAAAPVEQTARLCG